MCNLMHIFKIITHILPQNNIIIHLVKYLLSGIASPTLETSVNDDFSK